MHRESASYDSVHHPFNASQPSLSHSNTVSTPSSLCRPDFGDYPQDMSQSDCGASMLSEVPPSFDDTSDIDEVLPPINSSKPTLIKFVEPVVHRDHIDGQTQQRLLGMKKKMQRKKEASALHHDDQGDMHHLPVLGFADSGMKHGSDEALHKDVLKFPSVPARELHIAPPRQEKWNVDDIDIALADLVLDKGKLKSMVPPEGSFSEAADLALRSRVPASRVPAAYSVLDEFQEVQRTHLPQQPRVRTLSSARRAQGPPFDEPLPPLPSPRSVPSVSATSQDSTTPSANGKIAGLQPSHDHPLESDVRPARDAPARIRQPSSSRQVAAVDDEDYVFAFSPPGLSGHGHEGVVARSRPGTQRLDSRSSSNHSSIRDSDPREIIQRARMQPLSCGLEAEVNDSLDLASECSAFDRSSSVGAHAEDLPPLLSNHYLQGIDQAELERLNRLPERVRVAAAASAANSSHKLSHKRLSKHKKGAGAASAVSHYEPVSILRAEAAFLKEDPKREQKKKMPWQTRASSSSSASSRSHGGASSLSLGRSDANGSTSDISSVSRGHQRLRSFKSSMRLKSMK